MEGRGEYQGWLEKSSKGVFRLAGSWCAEVQVAGAQQVWQQGQLQLGDEAQGDSDPFSNSLTALE